MLSNNREQVGVRIKPKKVEIIIEDGHNYAEGIKGGAPFTSVGFNAISYGAGHPCDNEEEIQNAIKHCKDWIKYEGDIPVIVDKRKKAQLTNWF